MRAKLRLNPHRTALPSIFLANVRSLFNKLDTLKYGPSHRKSLWIFTETWHNNDIPTSVVELEGRSIFRAEKTADTTGKSRGGGLCIYVNKTWCTDCVTVDAHCSADLEYLIRRCRPFYLPREFSCIVAIAVYVPPDANSKAAMKELSIAINKLQTKHPNGAFIVTGDFNHCNLRTVHPKLHQNITCFTRGSKTLDPCYTNVAAASKATPLPHLGQCDHISLFLMQKYSPLIKRVKPTTKTVKVWMEDADPTLQDQLQHTDWTFFLLMQPRAPITTFTKQPNLSWITSTCVQRE